MRFIISAIFSKTNDKLLLEFRPVYLNYFKKMRNNFAKGGNVVHAGICPRVRHEHQAMLRFQPDAIGHLDRAS